MYVSTWSLFPAPLPLDDVVCGADEHREEDEAGDDGASVAAARHRHNRISLGLCAAVISRQGLG